MACIYVKGGWCTILDKKCDNCCNDNKKYIESLKQAVERKDCEHKGNYTGLRSCNCPNSSLLPYFYCKLKELEVSAKHCLNCPIK